MTTTVSLVGSTGSIGTQAADVIAGHPELFRVKALGARSSIDIVLAQVQRLRPEIVAIVDEVKAAELRPQLPAGVELRAGADALASLAIESDVTLNAVVGFAGLPVTLTALEGGKRLALANKESLIAAGPLVQRVRNTPGAEILPVDSEHAALHQCLRSETDRGAGSGRAVRRLLLTASGGPFRGWGSEQLGAVTVDQALNHPTWKMGPKITIDSSTLFNKGLEVIEARELFNIDYDRIDVVVHPQSVLHSAVEFTDGSTIGQLSMPDMRLPIGYALGHPDRLPTAYGAIDWTSLGALTFEPPDRRLFRCLDLAFEAGRIGGTAPTWLNAANEVAVQAFLDRRVNWVRISSIIEETLSSHDGQEPDSVESVSDADKRARTRALEVVNEEVH